jgi:hypothetical protein
MREHGGEELPHGGEPDDHEIVGFFWGEYLRE